ncbi:hypothetical protein [Pseudarthrobacter defluvii]|uniref:hypothetical protein n=1 Tax=Pseudarthrobacter defluvii TaxID=410837 RepID=UPI0025787955|nr:hypothetical protein [Pseudarthrobacter defluvii]
MSLEPEPAGGTEAMGAAAGRAGAGVPEEEGDTGEAGAEGAREGLVASAAAAASAQEERRVTGFPASLELGVLGVTAGMVPVQAS